METMAQTLRGKKLGGDSDRDLTVQETLMLTVTKRDKVLPMRQRRAPEKQHVVLLNNTFKYGKT